MFLNNNKKEKEIKVQRVTDKEGDTPFRSNRFFSVGEKWYFSTREGFDSGPYANKNRAELSLQRFLQIITKLPAATQH